MALFRLIGGPLALIGGVRVLFGAWGDPSSTLFLFTAAEIAWELSLSVYPIVRGFRPSAILTGPPVVPQQPA
jgi:hypothetical protein